MQRRPLAAVSSLTPTMPPSLTRRRESHASQDSSPRTPPNSSTPLPFMPPPSQNRYSSDSWNSSNYSGMEDLEAEWCPEQTRLLIRVSPCSYTVTHFTFSCLLLCLSYMDR